MKGFKMLLNCDMGESFGNYSIGADSEVMPYVDMANIACGMHASDPGVMDHTVSLAAAHNVTVGAHPGYPDLQGFGRRDLALSPKEVEDIALYQVGALTPFCKKHGARLEYIKPHGALYNTMMRETDILQALLVTAAHCGLKLMILATSNWQQHKNLARQHGVELILEGFVDRGYEDDGSLVNRKKDGALLNGPSMVERVKHISNGSPIRSVSGVELEFPIDSLCVHGDGKGVPLIKEFRKIIDAR